uniref:Synemin n=1 Tax=Sphenodon punctatus TaxID=8508 RepID=A0A8D0GVP4_SPHPU
MQAEEWDERRQLRELNCRLRDYVGRVRALEQENRLLAEEVAGLRDREQAAASGPLEEEVAGLRLQVAELERARLETELERARLREELAWLGSELLESERRRRGGLEPELAGQRRQLAGLRAESAALEELLAGLREERGCLREHQRREAGALRAELTALPSGSCCAVAAAAVGLSAEGLAEGYALALGWSCRESGLRYREQLREQEARLGREKLKPLRAESARARQQLEQLRRQGEQLSGLGQRQEQELLARQEQQEAERHDYQRIIEALEEEKQFLIVSLNDYLRDYHELLQVKAGLSLEVATYRALLEGESSQWILTWTEQQRRQIPEEVRNLYYDYASSYSAYRRENQKRALPAIKSASARYKPHAMEVSNSALYSTRTMRGRPQASATGRIPIKEVRGSEYRPSTTVKKDTSYKRTMKNQRELRTFAPPYGFWRESEIQQKTFPERKKMETTVTSATSYSTDSRSFQRSNKDRKDDAIPFVSENVRTKVDRSSKFPSYELNSNFRQSKYEKSLDETHASENEKKKGAKTTKEEIITVLDERDTKKKPTQERRETLLVERKTENKSTTAAENLNFGKKIEVAPGTEQKKYIMEDVIFTGNKRIILGDTAMEDKTPRNERNEQIKVYTSARKGESDPSEKETNVISESRRKETFEIPIHYEGRTLDETSRNNVEITLQRFRPSVEREKDEDLTKPVEITKGKVPEKESNLKSQQKIDDKGSIQMGTSLTENIAENIVADILKGFVQSPGETSPDAKITSFEKRECFEGGKDKTEINVQSRVQENVNISDEVDAKKVLGDVKGTPAEDVIEDTINVGLKEKESKGKRTVSVEIVEEPLEAATDERHEFSTPFEVEEAEDASGWERHYCDEEESNIMMTSDDLKKKEQPGENVTRLEEVTEADDSVAEQRYFVSTPDEYPLPHEKEDDSLYGQIHIEEESTIKYSWQDEFLQGTQSSRSDSTSSPELTYQVTGEEASEHILKQEHPTVEASHAESIVIEREIKIPHEFQTTIKGLLLTETKDPKHQLKEALEQLEGSLPESVKKELSVLTKESQADSSSVAVEIKKVERTEEGGLVTIVAEVNLSETLDTDQFSLGQLGEDISSAIEKVSPQSPNKESFNEQCKSGFPPTEGKSRIEIDLSPSSSKSTPWANQEVYSSFRLRDRDGMEYHTSEQVIHEGSASESVVSGVSSSQGSTEINQSIQHIKVGPGEIRRTEHVLYEGPISENVELSGRGDLIQVEGSSDGRRSVKHFKVGPQTIQTTEEIIYQGPVTKTLHVGGPENLKKKRCMC